MNVPKFYIEKIKTFILVVLFFITVLLLYFFWIDSPNNTFQFSLKDLIPGNDKEYVLPISDVIKPEETLVKVSGYYTTDPLNHYETWERGLDELVKFCEPGDIVTEEISEEKYQEAMESRETIQYSFAYSMPFNEFCSKFSIKRSQGFDQIDSFNKISYANYTDSDEDPDSILISDTNAGKYYRIYSDIGYTGFREIIKIVEAASYDLYFTVGTTFGVENNTAVLPITLNLNLNEVSYQQEIYAGADQSQKINDFAKLFFGSSFDFVRTITETNGNLIYMYGYGEKILTVFTDGRIEYKEETSTNLNVRFFDALDIALEFIPEHGGWDPLEGRTLKPYLKQVETVNQDKKRGYRFYFGMELDNHRIYHEKDDFITVEVLGDTVTSYTRNMLNIEEDAVTASTSDNTNIGNLSDGEDKQPMAIMIIQDNYMQIFDILAANDEIDLEEVEEGQVEVDTDYYFNTVAMKIENIQTGYICLAGSQKEKEILIPGWIVTFGKVTIYFDNEAGELIGYRVNN